MANLNENCAKISYPCFWKYKIILSKEQNFKEITDKILKDKEFRAQFSNTSSNANYTSHDLSVFVSDENERNRIFNEFKQVCKFVL